MITSVPYRLRSFDPQNPGDVERMNLMYYHPEVMKAKGYFTDDFDFAKITDLHDVDKTIANIDYKVTKKSHDVMYSVVDAKDTLVGWIWFYQDSRYPLPSKVIDAYGLTSSNSLILQVSYQKLMSSGWPTEILEKLSRTTKLHLHLNRKGVIVEGLKLALKKLKAGFEKLYKIRPKLVIYGFISPDNIGSAKVLSYNGFVKNDKKYRCDGEFSDLWVKMM